MGFGSDVDKWTIKTKGKEHKAVSYICYNLASAIIKRTPVDTGMARNNWQSAINVPNYSTSSQPNKAGTGALLEAASKANNAAGNVFLLINSLDYIKRLEEGSSKQAMQGMVRVSVSAIRNLLKRAIQ